MASMPSQMTCHPAPWNDQSASAASTIREISNSENVSLVINVNPVSVSDAEIHRDVHLFESSSASIVVSVTAGQKNTTHNTQGCLTQTEKDFEGEHAEVCSRLNHNKYSANDVIELDPTVEGEVAQETAFTSSRRATLDNSSTLMTGSDVDFHGVPAKVTVICPDSEDEADIDNRPTTSEIPGINLTSALLNHDCLSASETTMLNDTYGRPVGLSGRDGPSQSEPSNKDSFAREFCISEASQIPPENMIEENIVRQNMQSGQSFNSYVPSEALVPGNDRSPDDRVLTEKISKRPSDKANHGADTTANCLEKNLDSTLISYLTNFQSRMQSVDTGPAQPLLLMMTNDVSGVPVSQQVATSFTGTSDSVHRSSSAMMLAPSLTSKALHPGLETSQPNQDLCSSTLQEDPPSGCSIDPQVTGLMNRRKRRQSPSSVIPVHVKEEKVDESYETTTPQPAAAKIQVLDVSQGQQTVASRSQQPPQPSAVHSLARNPNRCLNPHQSIVTSSASTANALLLGRPRTVPAYRFAHFRTLVPKNVPTLGTVANGSNSLARFVSSNTQTTARPNFVVQQGYQPPVTSAPPNPRSLIRHSRWTAPSTLQSKAILTPPQSQFLIFVNHQNPTTSQLGVVASTIQASVTQSSSRTNCEVASLGNGKSVRPLKVRASNTNAALLTRKFEQLYKRSILPKFASPKLMPNSLHVSTPLKTLTCEGCGDEFVTERGLSDHYERKSIVISFTCRCDKKAMMFYNMCSYARFYTRHTSVNQILHSFKHHSPYDSSVMAMLPPYLMPPEYQRLVAEGEKRKKLGKAAVTASSTANVEAQSSTQVAASTASHVATAAEQPRLMVSSIKEFFNVIERLNVNCPECPAVYKRRKGLVAHMSGQRPSPKGELYRCDRCCMVLHNACSFRSHTRIHDKVQPYVCPECGLVFRSSRDIFMKHVKKVCLHFSRFQSRQCPVCSATLSHSEETMVAHLENAHTALYYKCKSCTMTFPTEKGFRTHNRAQHDQAATSEAFRKCPICNATEKDPQTLTSHLNQHVVKDGFGPLCFFRCLFCHTSFATRSDIIDHTRSAHPSEMITGQMCEVCGAVCNNGVTLYAHTKAQHEVFLTQLLSADACKTACDAGQTGSAGSAEVEPATPAPDAETGSQPGQKSLECDRCQMTLSDEKQLKRHMAKHRFLEGKRTGAKLSEGREKKKQRMDETSVASESVQIKSEQVTDEVPATSKFDQLTPVQLSVVASSSESVRRENEAKSSKDAVLSWFSCHLCEKTFKNTDDLQQHLRDTHTGKSRLHAYLCWICREQSELKSYPKAGMLIKHMKNFHKIARKNIDYTRIASFNNKDNESTTGDEEKPTICDASLVRSLRVEGDMTYNCAKCEFSSTERTTFREHIAKHRQNESHQCLECGISFVVLPSLKRHLFVVHRVRDFDRYQSETGLSLELPAVTEPDFDPEDSFPSGNANHRLSNTDADSSIQSDELIVTSPEKDSTSTLECTVCYRSFADQCTLRQHMRVHGMAFIQGTRRSNLSRKSASSDS